MYFDTVINLCIQIKQFLKEQNIFSLVQNLFIKTKHHLTDMMAGFLGTKVPNTEKCFNIYLYGLL